jgi:epoxyqueuosine reductase
VLRSKRRGLVRNACVAAGNWGDAAAVPALLALIHDPEPLVRGHAAWALGCITGEARLENIGNDLRSTLPGEEDPWVREEIELALGQATSG